jgi:hypothetical protein
MTAPRVERIDGAEADARAAQMGLPLWPGTLYRDYLEADALRDPALEPIWVAVHDGPSLWIHGLHRRCIEGCAGLFDASAPYGYGGPLCRPADADFLPRAWRAYAGWMSEQGVVVEYVRFHPLLSNERWYGGRVNANRPVVWVDLGDADFARHYAPRLRSTLNKAARLGLRYEEQALATAVPAFGAYYRRAMREMGADPFFDFSDDYFARLAQHPGARLGVCRGSGGDVWLAACLMLDGAGMTEYHLAATCAEGRRAGASSHALHQAALAARGRGLRVLYLGGGSDTRPDNPLLFFKASFSPLRATYHTGFQVFDPERYDALKRHFAPAWAAHPERPIFYRKV